MTIKLSKKNLPVKFIFLSAFLTRFIFLIETIDHPLFIPISGGLDDFFYHQIAFQILSGNFPSVSTGTFLYPLILAGIYSVSNVLGAKIIQIILGSLSCVLIFLITKKIFNKTSAYLASMIAIIYPVSIFHDTILIYSSYSIFLNLAAILILLKDKVKKSSIFFSGIFLGLSLLLSPTVIFFIPGVILWLLTYYKKKIPLKKIFFLIAMFLFGVCMVVSVFLIRNFIVEKHISPTTPYFGIGFYIGNNPNSEGVFKPILGVRHNPMTQTADFEYLAQSYTGQKLSPFQVSRYWIGESFKFIKENPFSYLKLQFNKFLLFFNNREHSDLMQNLNYFKEYSILIRILSFISFGLIGPLGLMGMALSFFKSKKAKLLVIYILSYLFMMLIFYVTSRYRLPAVYAFFPFAGYFLNFTIYQASKKNYKKLLYILPFLVFFILFVNINLSISSQDEISHYNLGVIYMSQERIQEAKKEFKQALKQNPFDIQAYFALGEVYYKQENYELALKKFKKCIDINPFFFDAKFNLALTYSELQQYEKSNKVLYDFLDHIDKDIDVEFLIFKNFLLSGNCVKAKEQLEKIIYQYPYKKRIINEELEKIGYNKCKFLNNNY